MNYVVLLNKGIMLEVLPSRSIMFVMYLKTVFSEIWVRTGVQVVCRQKLGLLIHWSSYGLSSRDLVFAEKQLELMSWLRISEKTAFSCCWDLIIIKRVSAKSLLIFWQFERNYIPTLKLQTCCFLGSSRTPRFILYSLSLSRHYVAPFSSFQNKKGYRLHNNNKIVHI